MGGYTDRSGSGPASVSPVSRTAPVQCSGDTGRIGCQNLKFSKKK